jgi:hypothetical protein
MMQGAHVLKVARDVVEPYYVCDPWRVKATAAADAAGSCPPVHQGSTQAPRRHLLLCCCCSCCCQYAPPCQAALARQEASCPCSACKRAQDMHHTKCQDGRVVGFSARLKSDLPRQLSSSRRGFSAAKLYTIILEHTHVARHTVQAEQHDMSCWVESTPSRHVACASHTTYTCKCLHSNQAVLVCKLHQERPATVDICDKARNRQYPPRLASACAVWQLPALARCEPAKAAAVSSTGRPLRQAACCI